MTSTIQEFVNNKNLILPSIQRGFVWDEEQICKLFDSILRGYPIGNLLMWKLDGNKLKEKGIKFYKFLNEYNLSDGEYNNEIKNQSPDKEFLAVLDGQQRTQSLLLGLQGKIINNKRKKDLYQKKTLYINLLGKSNPEEDFKYEFKFLSQKELENDTENKWFEVGKTLMYKKTSDFQREVIKDLKISESDRENAIDILSEMFNKFNEHEVISWFEIQPDAEIEEVLDIFIRTNSGGEVLTKTDLLFSTIVAGWEDFRENVETLLDNINNKNGTGVKFEFNKDFIMRALLYVIDNPIEMKVNTFKDNIPTIKKVWNDFEYATKKTVEILTDLGYSSHNLKANNAVMPIIYYVFKKGIVNNKTKEELKKYLVVSQLKKLYGVASNSTLTNVRSELIMKDKKGDLVLKNNKFEYSHLKNVKIVGDRNFNVDDDTIDSWFNYKKNEYTFMILTLLYPTAKIGSKEFHQDHMHPYSLLRKNSKFSGMEDLLANLQLLEGKENEEKNKTLLKDWLKNKDNYEYAKEYLPKCSYEIENYKTFLEERKKIMKKKLKEILKI